MRCYFLKKKKINFWVREENGCLALQTLGGFYEFCWVEVGFIEMQDFNVWHTFSFPEICTGESIMMRSLKSGLSFLIYMRDGWEYVIYLSLYYLRLIYHF